MTDLDKREFHTGWRLVAMWFVSWIIGTFLLLGAIEILYWTVHLIRLLLWGR